MKRRRSYDSSLEDLSISNEYSERVNLVPVVVLPYDISSYIALLSMCTSVHVSSSRGSYKKLGDRFQDSGLSIKEESELDNFTLPNAWGYYFSHPSLSDGDGYYYQDYFKDYFKISNKMRYKRLYASDRYVRQRLDADPTQISSPYKKCTFAMRIQREQLRLYKFWLICQLQIIPPS